MLKYFSFIAALLVLSQAQALHYGMAGCGLGSLVFQDQPGKIQIVAATVNNLVSPQTSAITSGTSGCFENASGSAKINFIETNIVTLKADSARGNGETLESLITMMGCKDSQSIKSEIKNNYNSIFENQSSEDILNAIKSNQNVQKNCSTLS